MAIIKTTLVTSCNGTTIPLYPKTTADLVIYNNGTIVDTIKELEEEINNKVKAVPGKGLTNNDYTDDLKDHLLNATSPAIGDMTNLIADEDDSIVTVINELRQTIIDTFKIKE